MEQLNHWVEVADGYLWGYVLVFLLVGTGIYLTFRMRGIQIFGLRHGIRLTRGLYHEEKEEGDLSHFQALATALSATVGVGNIAGVAIAIRAGGPGALFWMWVTAAVGMATKFTSCTLAVKYRAINEDGTVSGGPMYFIEKGLGPNWKWLAVIFAVLAGVGSFGAGCMAQAGELTRALLSLFPVPAAGAEAGLAGSIGRFIQSDPYLARAGVGLVIAFMVGIVIIGGIHRIGEVTSQLVPFMAVFYVGAALVIIILNYAQLPHALWLVFSDAFTGTAAAGGFAGSAFIVTMQMGIRRGLFSNESGQGSAPIAHATAKTPYPVREGYVALLEPFIDTIIICSLTGLVIILTGAWTTEAKIDGADLTSAAFSMGLGPLHSVADEARLGRMIVTFGVILFAYSTAISWSYYGDRCVGYLFGLKAVKPYRVLFCCFLVVGATIKIDLVWNLCDIMNGGMAIPNLVALILLSGVVWKELREYRVRIPEFDRQVAETEK
jgi:AGCS family alanine or glycine:cation symporter